ncbi:hypothetical protein QCA50_013179 [Cerrena zonata]|uniref:Uncharacterized protein n=1 Tax=Cerrena zonata TaxID=2478898 RepID=A0AAW0FRX7_9APHY
MVVHTARTLSRRLDRLEPAQRLVRSRKRRSDLHLPRVQVKKSLTFAERTIRKDALANARANMKTDLQAALDRSPNFGLHKTRDEIRSLGGLLSQKYGNSVEHWYDRIMQSSRLAKTSRRTNRWNVYVSLRLRELNLAIPAGSPKLKANDPEAMDKIRSEWAAMSAEERVLATEEHMKAMTEDRAMRLTGENNSGIAAFHDAISTFKSVENQLQALYVRTGVEVLMFAVRSSQEQWFRPYVMMTSDRAGNFFHTCFNQDTETYATRFEAYCLSGIEGVQNRVSAEIAALKAQCTTGILAQLNDLLTPTVLSKMVYSDFFTQITLKHHIIYENWPVSKFCTPGKLTLLELRRLHHVLTNGAPLFHHVPLAEWDELDLDAFQTNHASFSPTAAQPLGATAMSAATTSTTTQPSKGDVMGSPNNDEPGASNGDATGASNGDAAGASNGDAAGASNGDAAGASNGDAAGASNGGMTITETSGVAAAPALPQAAPLPATLGGNMLTLDGGMVIKHRQ